jgi:hypothetical protein
MKKDNIILIIMGIILILLVYIIVVQPDDNTTELKEYWENKDFKSDSTTVYVDYSRLPKPEYKNYVPPAVVINYVDSTKTFDNTYLSLNDSLLLVIDSLEQEVRQAYSLIFLKSYPNAPKFLYGEFNRDSIRLDLLRPDGSITKNSFGINYDRFIYQWTESGELRAKSVKGNRNSKFSHSLYGYGGYEFLIKNLVVGVDYSIYLQRYRFQGRSYLIISNEPELFAEITLGYSILKK